MSKNTGKSWSQGFRRVPNTFKYLAGDPDIKFSAFINSENSEDEQDSENEEIVCYSNEDLTDSQSEATKIQNPVTTKEINLDPANVSISSDTYTVNDIPLSPATREDIIEYLNRRIEDKISKDDEC